MDNIEYKMMAELLSKVPPSKETPKGQKFHIGEIVRIVNPKSWFAKRNYGQLFSVEYSYYQKYGGPHGKNEYCLRHLPEDWLNSWYDEDELELVKGISKINEEKEFAEYQRLKQKYEQH